MSAASLRRGTRRARVRVWGTKILLRLFSSPMPVAAAEASSPAEAPPFEGFAALCAETEQQTRAVSRLLLQEVSDVAMPLPAVVRHIVASGGKRLRSRLLIASARLLDFRGKETILLGGALEAIHCASLLHDDVVDGSKMRRGLPAAHHLWGAQASVLVGDFLFARAFDLMCRQSEPRIMTLLSKTALRLTQGEVRQLYSARALSMTPEACLEIVGDKTGALFRAATMSAALLARASEKQTRALARFGEQFGIGYQLADDMLDYLGESRTLGKRRGDDLKEGKVTYPLVLCLSRIGKKQRRRMEQLLRCRDCSDEDIDEVASLMRKHGCFEECADVARARLVDGAQALEGIGDARLRGILQHACLSSLNRLS